jgi:hypothetical protein
MSRLCPSDSASITGGLSPLMSHGSRRTILSRVGHAKKERVSLFGTDQRITSGPAARRPHSKAEYMTAPDASLIVRFLLHRGRRPYMTRTRHEHRSPAQQYFGEFTCERGRCSRDHFLLRFRCAELLGRSGTLLIRLRSVREAPVKYPFLR